MLASYSGEIRPKAMAAADADMKSTTIIRLKAAGRETRPCQACSSMPMARAIPMQPASIPSGRE